MSGLDERSPDAARSVWRVPGYPRWFTADTAIVAGGALRSFALPLLALQILGSPQQVGVAMAVGQAGILISTIPGGILKDTRPRSRILSLSAMVAGATILLATAAYLLPAPANLVTTFALMLVVGCRAGALLNTTDLMLPDLVPAKHLPHAYAANQARDSAVQMTSAPVSAVLYQVFPLLPVAVDAATAACGAFLLRNLAVTPPTAPPPRAHVLRFAVKGLHTLWRESALRGLVTISVLLMGTLNAATVTLVVAARHTGYTALQVSLIELAIGVGILVGAAAIPLLVKRAPGGPTLIASIIWMAAMFSLTALTGDPIAVLCLLFLTALPLPLANAIAGGYAACIIPSDVRGRSFAVIGILGAAVQGLLLMWFGSISEHNGVPATLGAAAAILAVCVALALAVRPVRTIPNPASWSSPAGHSETSRGSAV